MSHRGKCEKDFIEQGPKGQNMIFRIPEGQKKGQQGQRQGPRAKRRARSP